jgi:hypothetical protein
VHEVEHHPIRVGKRLSSQLDRSGERSDPRKPNTKVV